MQTDAELVAVIVTVPEVGSNGCQVSAHWPAERVQLPLLVKPPKPGLESLIFPDGTFELFQRSATLTVHFAVLPTLTLVGEQVTDVEVISWVVKSKTIVPLSVV
jgi:hypothetical protein